MAAKKVYAVRKGNATGIFYNWESCKKAVTGYGGAQYKGFSSLEEAREYLSGAVKPGRDSDKKAGLNKQIPLPDDLPDAPDKVIAYVDGSYDNALQKYSFGCVFLLADGTVYTESGNGDNPESLLLRNVTGEMLGAMFAVQFAMLNEFKRIEICYDYQGIAKWVTGEWKSKTDLTKKYTAAMQEWNRLIGITFTKVTAHTNVYYNEMADQLAKAALRSGNGIPKVRRKEEMAKEIWEKSE